MLRDEMWNIFNASGNINAYLYFKDSTKKDNKSIDRDNIEEKEKMIQSL